MLQTYRYIKQLQIITALILTGLLSVGNGFTFIKSANALSTDFLAQTPNELLKQNSRTNRLPRAVVNAILRDIANRQGSFAGAFEITDYSQQTWRNGCLELQRPEELCGQALVPGWRVVVSSGRQRWVYHSNQTGSVVRLNERGNTRNLPQNVRNAVLREASEITRLPVRALSIVEFQQTNRAEGCERSTYPYPCDQIVVSGWQVTVGAGDRRWIFVSNENGSRVELKSGTNNSALPQSIREAVLADASRRARTRIALSPRNITQAQRVVWSNGCLDLGGAAESCLSAQVPGWRVTVTVGAERFVYHTNNNSQVRFNQAASTTNGNVGTGEAIPIPRNELPLPLDQGVVFRQISSGGLAGRTYETILRDDGLLIRVRIGDANDSERTVRRVAVQQVRQFQRLLERTAEEFQNISYPAPRGAADFITYTLTSEEGTVQYNDISQNNLPQDLQTLLQTWRDILNNAR